VIIVIEHLQAHLVVVFMKNLVKKNKLKKREFVIGVETQATIQLAATQENMLRDII